MFQLKTNEYRTLHNLQHKRNVKNLLCPSRICSTCSDTGAGRYLT